MNPIKQKVYDYLLAGVAINRIPPLVNRSHSSVEKYAQQLIKEHRADNQAHLMAMHYLGKKQARMIRNGATEPATVKQAGPHQA